MSYAYLPQRLWSLILSMTMTLATLPTSIASGQSATMRARQAGGHDAADIDDRLLRAISGEAAVEPLYRLAPVPAVPPPTP